MAEDSQKKAMVIGISEYDNLPSLDFCKNGGKDMYTLLKEKLDYSFPQDYLIETVTSADLKMKIYDFFHKDVNASDTLLFFFTGHGIVDLNDRGYFCTSDIDPKHPDRNGVRFSYLTDQMDDSESRRIMTIIDSCHSGKVLQSNQRILGDNVDPETVAVEHGRAVLKRELSRGEGRCVLASALSNANAFGMEGSSYSAFTHFLLEGLKKNKQTVDEQGRITPDKLSMYLSDQLKIAQGDYYQRPVQHFSGIGGSLVIGEYDIVPNPSPSRSNTESVLSRLKNLLVQGNVSEFNRLREESPRDIVVFESFVCSPNADLHGINLQNAVLIDADFTGANLKGANLEDVRLDQANLTNADLTGSRLVGAKLLGAECRYAKFDETEAVNVNFVDANLESTSFHRAFVRESNLSRANLRNAKLTDANFDGALLRGANLEYADLQNANFEKATCDRANFSYANMTGAHMGGANTFKAIFTGTIGCKKFLGI